MAVKTETELKTYLMIRTTILILNWKSFPWQRQDYLYYCYWSLGDMPNKESTIWRVSNVLKASNIPNIPKLSNHFSKVTQFLSLFFCFLFFPANLFSFNFQFVLHLFVFVFSFSPFSSLFYLSLSLLHIILYFDYTHAFKNTCVFFYVWFLFPRVRSSVLF